ncbi:PTS-dependent dihydroxyacetone kinase 1, dihydroxyacetone-binding subunit DhaK-like isoform X2 [Rhodnius prolixus]
MSTKALLLNDKNDVEKEMLEAIAGTYPGLFVDSRLRILMINRERKERVALVSGGGAGHEPFPAGYVGEGMLTAGIAGKVFTSPPISSILTAILTTAKLNKGGVLLLVENYTGDVLNFASAMEIARTKGYKVECIIISDDVANLGTDVRSVAGRRGMVGFVLVAKILGCLSKEGKSIDELVTVGRCLNSRLGTFGVCFKPCTLPGSSEPMFRLDKNNIEFGLGVHGEAGISTVQMTSLKDIVEKMLKKIMACLMLKDKSNVVVVVNNLGSLSQMEMLVISREVRLQIEAMKINVDRLYSGTLFTSINMKGFQISILNITDKEHWLCYLDEETEAFAWPGKRISHAIEKSTLVEYIEADNSVTVVEGMILNEKQGEVFRKSLHAISIALIKECETLNQLDTVVGDGDCGTTMRHFAEGILQELQKFPIRLVASTLAMLSKLAESLMGGTSGAIFSLMLMGAAKDCDTWESCWLAGIEMIQKYSKAKVGDRTLLDALIPAYKGFVTHLKENGAHSWPIALKIAYERAKQGCEATKNMIARAGRASYVEQSKITDVDPGAYAIVIVLRTLVKGLVPEDHQCLD